jgi:hypothetical protein
MAARPWIRVYPQEPNDAIQPVRANPGPRNMPRRNAFEKPKNRLFGHVRVKNLIAPVCTIKCTRKLIVY